MIKREHGIYSSERMVTYVDAIFAIALTLLVIEIKIPEHADGDNLIMTLWQEWPKFISFLISFMIISVVWFNHHTMFHYIKKIDHTLILMNTILMLNVIAIPFCSSILGEYADAVGENSKVAALIYGGWITLGGIPFNFIWSYALKHKELLHDGCDMDDLINMKKHFIRGPYIYLFVTLLALLNAWVSVVGFAFLIILYFLPATFWIRKEKRNPL
ncbi:DUF1211 domain-containing protein [Bacillus sp. BRMEA1]|uniref:TMEM175 family protein n=1 Tax=Neobacillus endophyticus TaxID=2738405 RepID=UPI001567B1D8|nr:TMEM175 family protein [Neobacillus endophyticus]NRD77111.1 DUF1211 domain-containing protein [Neobacillus endophyticus]